MDDVLNRLNELEGLYSSVEGFEEALIAIRPIIVATLPMDVRIEIARKSIARIDGMLPNVNKALELLDLLQEDGLSDDDKAKKAILAQTNLLKHLKKEFIAAHGEE